MNRSPSSSAGLPSTFPHLALHYITSSACLGFCCMSEGGRLGEQRISLCCHGGGLSTGLCPDFQFQLSPVPGLALSTPPVPQPGLCRGFLHHIGMFLSFLFSSLVCPQPFEIRFEIYTSFESSTCFDSVCYSVFRDGLPD